MEAGAGQVESLLQTIDSLKLDVAKALRGLCQLVLHNSDIGHAAASKQVGDVIGSRIEGKVPNVGSEGRLSWKSKRLANGVSTPLSTF